MKHIIAAAVTSIILGIMAFAGLYLLAWLLPAVAEEYYSPVFRMGSDKAYLYYLHPVIISIALTWFWHRFKGQFAGRPVSRGIELGLVYGVVAIIPAMLINFSVFNVSLPLVLCWLGYGLLQGIIAGIIFAFINP